MLPRGTHSPIAATSSCVIIFLRFAARLQPVAPSSRATCLSCSPPVSQDTRQLARPTNLHCAPEQIRSPRLSQPRCASLRICLNLSDLATIQQHTVTPPPSSKCVHSPTSLHP